VDRLLVPDSRLDTKFLAGSIVGWFGFAFAVLFCVVAYLVGHTFVAHLSITVVALALAVAHISIIGAAAHNLVPDARRQIHAQFLELIACPDRPSPITHWMAANQCDTVTCAKPATVYLKLNAASFWVTAAFVGVIVTTFVGIGIILILMTCVRREPPSSEDGSNEIELNGR
jgi:hypothetical protein